ncbi:MAG: CotH kinase family protein [Bacteroidota bacterium]
MKLPLLILSVSLIVAPFYSNAQVVINEVQTSNLKTITDEYGSNDDWVELYNTSAVPFDLTGYELSDNYGESDKFIFPSYTIGANEHLVVFASGFNYTSIGGHWETAVNGSDSWKYRANTSAPTDTNWRNLSFNSAAWSNGIGGIGYGDGDDNTTISTCISLYMLKTFAVSDTTKIVNAILNIDFDDAFVAYLNGVEIARANIGAAGVRPAWDLVANGGHEAVMYQGMNPDSFILNMNTVRSAMINGTNVLAVEIHNLTANNVDMSAIPFLSFKMIDATTMFGPVPAWFSFGNVTDHFHADFKLSKSGESIYLTDPFDLLVDSVMVPAMELDDAYQRNPDGSAQWCFTDVPTPGTTNATGACKSGYATIPLFNLQSGFYPNTQSLVLSTTFPGGVIHYTTNGNTPDGTSPIYSSPISISTTKSIRASVFAINVLPSAVITNTYFINFDCKLPVYVLTTDSANLWDYNTGIYVEGPNAEAGSPHFGANYWMDWEKPTSLEYFDKDKNRAFRFTAGLKITGGWSRQANQKPLEISMGDRYGLGQLNYPLLNEKPWVDKFNDFVLHTAGNDRGVAHMRDAVMERLLVPTHVDHISFEPCLLFMNGAQWGVYYTRENDDHHFIEENYGIDKDDIDLLKESYFVPNAMEVKKGSDSAFFAMYDYAMNTSPSNVNYFATMNSMMDIENMVDYFSAETFYPNGDWMGGGNNNLKLWRQRSTNGRFRYLSYDFDFGYGLNDPLNSDVLGDALAANPHNFQSDIFARLIQNPQYKNYFINRYADLINTIWLPSNVTTIANAFKESMRHDMHFEFENGWAGGDTNAWKANITSMINFATQRPSYARNIIQSDLGMTSQVTLTLQASPAGAGRIQISTITPSSLPWSGVYFNGNPVTITAIPNPGYTFDHWHSNVVISTNDLNQSTTYNFTSSDQITAFFNGSPATAQVSISELNYNSDSASDAGDWIELKNLAAQDIDISGWKIRDEQQQHVYTFPANSVIVANGYLVIAEDLQKFSSEHPAVTNVTGELGFNLGNGGDQVRLFDYRDSLYQGMEYFDDLSWPQGADGGGYTLELLSAAGNLSDGSNWFDGCLGGSPGTAYTAGIATATASGDTSFCDGGSVTLLANTGAGLNYQWQVDSQEIQGATNSSYNATTTGMYSVVVTSNGCAAVSDSIEIAVAYTPADPVVITTVNCGSGSFTLVANSADSVNWYDAPNGNLLGSGDSFNTPLLTQSTVYFVQATNICTSAFVPDSVIITSVSAEPVVYNASACLGNAVSLVAVDTTTTNWYDAIGGNLVFTGDTLVIPALSQNTTYYVQSGVGCLSSFVPIEATVLANAADPVVNDTSVCTGSIATLSATDTSTTNWYDAPNGNLLFSGDVYVTPALTQTTTYYVQSGITCLSNFIPVLVAILPYAADPVVTDAANCGDGSVTLNASSPETVYWYDAIGGNLVYIGNPFVTPVLSLTTTYYAVAGNNCLSGFVAVTAAINSIPVVNLGPDTIAQTGSTVTLDAGAGFSSYSWSTTSANQTIGVTSTGTYWVTVTDANGCSATDSISIQFDNAVHQLNLTGGISIYPNPVKGLLTVSINQCSCPVSLQLLDATGRKVWQEESQGEKTVYQMDMTGYAKGIYFLKLDEDNFGQVFKVVVE